MKYIKRTYRITTEQDIKIKRQSLREKKSESCCVRDMIDKN